MTTVRRSGVDGFRRTPKVTHILTLALLVAACGGAPATPAPYVPAPPAPTASPWVLAATIKYQPHATLGDTFDITVEVTNTGRAANPATWVMVNGLDNHADLAACSPTCSLDGQFGASLATFDGVAPGQTGTFTLTFQTTKLGKISPFVCVYDNHTGVQVDCGQASVVIGG